MLPFWTNLLIRTYALMMLLGAQGYVNMGLGAIWERLQLAQNAGRPPSSRRLEPAQLLYNNFAVVFGLVYVHLPFMVLPLYSALDRLDHSPD